MTNSGTTGQATRSGTHERILAAALHLFATHGFHGTGIREIAAAADVSTSNLYHYATNKEGILLQIMERSLNRLVDGASQIATAAESPRETIEQLVRMHVITHALSRESSSVVDDLVSVLEGEARDAVVRYRDKYESYFSDAIRGGVAIGEFSVPDESAARLGLLEMASGVARWFSANGRFTAPELAEIHVTLALALLGAKKTRPRYAGGAVLELVARVWEVDVR